MAEDTHAQATAGVIPFHRAVRAGDAVAVKLFLKYRADADTQDEDGATALHRAVEAVHTEIVRILLEDIDAGEWPALHSTAKANHTEIAELLRQYGATE